MTIRSIGALLRSGLLSLAVLTPATAPAAPITGTCSPAKWKFSASALDSSSTTSTTFVNIPQASVSFTQGGTSASCVVVRFSAQAFAQTGETSVVRAILDNATAALPADVQFSGSDDNAAGARSFEFIFPSVAPGKHVVRMQYKSQSSTTVAVHRHNMVVQYAP